MIICILLVVLCLLILAFIYYGMSFRRIYIDFVDILKNLSKILDSVSNPNQNTSLNEDILAVYSNFIFDTILSGQMEVWDVPFEVRSTKKAFYIASFRKYRYHINPTDNLNYEKTLDTLKNDITLLGNHPIVDTLGGLYECYCMN